MLFQRAMKHENNCRDRTQCAGTVLSLHLISLICVIREIRGSIFGINLKQRTKNSILF